MGSQSGRSGQTFVYYPGHSGGPLQPQVCSLSRTIELELTTRIGYSTGEHI